MKIKKQSPLKAKPLRNPGQSVDEEIRKVLDDEASQYIIIPLFAIFMAGSEWWRWYSESTFSPIPFTIVAIIAVVFSGFKIVKLKERIKSLKLGRDGEIAVGQYLELFRENEFKVFHDIIGNNGEEYNIDHVLIGRKGIFSIETKTYSKPAKGKSEITFDGNKILINGYESKTDIVRQARAESNWLTEKLKSLTGKTLKVKPVVVFPGWYINNIASKKTDLWVLNPKALKSFVLNSSEIYTTDEVKFIANNLSRNIRESQLGH